MANQALADFYFTTGLIKEGIALYEDVLRAMEERDAPLAKRFTIVRHLLNKDINETKRLFYLEKLEGYIADCEEKGIEMLDVDNPLYYVKYLYHRSYALLGIDKKDLSMTSKHLAQAEKLVKDNNIRNEDYTIANIRLFYYQIAKDYDRGTTLADDLIDYCLKRGRVVGALVIMKNKASLCYDVGRGMEAAKTYREYIAMKDSVTNAKFYKDLADLRTRHDIDKLELANKKMELEAAHSRTKLLVMGGGLSLLLLLCCFLGYISYSRHKYGLQLEKARDKAEEADRLKSAFLANMNHEIRTPLNGIVGVANLLCDREQFEPEEITTFIETIKKNCDLLLALISDIIDISCIESNTINYHFEECDVNDQINQIVTTQRVIIPGHLNLIKQIPEETTFIYIDKLRLNQVITNLINNAVKFTEQGSITIGYTANNPGFLEFFVKDTGRGIPQKDLKNIFLRYFKKDNYVQGAGLGLSICQMFVNRFGGEITVESEVGVGTCFKVKIPRTSKRQ